MGIDIVLEGLTAKQYLLADIVWSLQETEQVNAFLRALPPEDMRDCKTVIILMQIAVIDQYFDGTTEMDVVDEVLKRIASKR